MVSDPFFFSQILYVYNHPQVSVGYNQTWRNPTQQLYRHSVEASVYELDSTNVCQISKAPFPALRRFAKLGFLYSFISLQDSACASGRFQPHYKGFFFSSPRNVTE